MACAAKELGSSSFSRIPLNAASGSQITHDDKDVLCYVISGTGRLRSGEREMVLKQGSICHVPAGVSHDFQATGDRELVLFYTLIEKGASKGEAETG